MFGLRIALLFVLVFGVASFAHAGAMILTDPVCDSIEAVQGDNPTLTFTALPNGYGTRCFYNNGGSDDPYGVFPFQGLFEPPDDGRWTQVIVNLPSNNPFAPNEIYCSGGDAFRNCTVNTDGNGDAISITYSGVDMPYFLGFYPPGAFPGILEGFLLFVQLQNPDPEMCPGGTSNPNPTAVCAPWLDKDGNPLTFTASVVNAPVPEPATLALLASGGAGMFFRRRKKK